MAKIDFENMSTRDLLAMYNGIAIKLGEKPVNRFADNKSAVRRTKEILEREAAAKTGRKKREMYFTFAPDKDGVHNVKSSDSLRGRTVKLLLVGATLAQVKALVQEFDQDRGKGNAATIDRRAYELVRIMHYYLGYGVKKDDEGVITIYT